MPPPTAAKQLVDLIAQAVEQIEADTASQIPGGTTTDINSPVVAPEDTLKVTPERRKAIRTLKAATHQLLATLMPAGLYMLETYSSHFESIAIDIVQRGRIADLIHSIDPDSSKGGAHVEVLAEKAGINPRKLTHILRFLALRNIFCELSPDRWGNNRLSFTLRTDTPNTLSNYLEHHRIAVGLPAFTELSNVLFDKEYNGVVGKDHERSALQKHHKTDGDFYDFLSKYQGDYGSERFGKAMIETTYATGGGEAQYTAFEWHKLGPQGTLIDVGGGIGAAAYALSNYLPGWTVVIQDRAEVIKLGKQKYRAANSRAKLEFEEVDFWEDQPPHRVGKTDAYFLRHILHNWSSEDCVKILKNLRKAAKTTTRLLISEAGLEPQLADPNNLLLSHGGMASSHSHLKNMFMMTIFNVEERGEKQFSEIFHQSGWILEKSTPLATIVDSCIFEGVPDPNWKP